MENTDDPIPTPASVGKGIINFDMQSTLRSPFFWLLVGAGAVIALQYYGNKQKDRPRPMRNVTGTGE